MVRKPNPLSNPSSLFARTDTILGALFRKAQHLATLQHLLDRHLPIPARGYFQVASYAEEHLLLVTDSAHRAATLRYREAELIRSLKEEPELHHLKRIRFAIRPAALPEKRTKSREPLTDRAARHIASSAKYIEDVALRKALIKLSEHRSSR
jgi:hypothetical protein